MVPLLYTFAVLMGYMSVLYVIAMLRKDNGTADIGYGIGFLVAIVTALLLQGGTVFALTLAALVFVWGIRLASRIYVKNRGKPEDFRYRAWREAWGTVFAIRSFFQIYILQGTVIFVVVLPVLLAVIFPKSPVSIVFAAGILLWIVGFVFEAVGDYQLDQFITNPENKGKIMMRGLWRYSRHPNYFGESMMWWGIAIAASSVSAYPVLAFLSPMLITFLLLKVSGVPLLEKRWQGNPDWELYKARTSVFIPMPPKA